MKIGLDIGSTTIKSVVLDNSGEMVFCRYERHLSDVNRAVYDMLSEISEKFQHTRATISITGSSGIDIAKKLGVEFVQEVYACSRAVEQIIPETDVAVELGGEDAKIVYFGMAPELRMNGTCAGGTGAFIDQMAVLLETDAAGLDELAKSYQRIYPIASRCGVFAKTDIQPLLNEGAAKEDIAASIFQAVVNQTIAGLACGKPISGKVAFLGGPLTFLPQLRQRFIKTLALSPNDAVVPPYGQFLVAQGAAMASEGQEAMPINWISNHLHKLVEINEEEPVHLEPLFADSAEYDEFLARHNHQVKRRDLNQAEGVSFLGVDVGSTTTKIALVDQEGYLLYSDYDGNKGNPLDSAVEALRLLYQAMPAGLHIGRATVTGYGEALIKNALSIDAGEIETVAHQRGADEFLPGVEFVLDIGGQDMKCLEIKDGVINNIMLNEACSSGCGSFIETLAKSLQMDLEQFVSRALFSGSPADLGTRCTVFMNSKIKQVQKEGADVSSIAAGIAYSVVKNALYKVIRLKNASQIGEKIVVQGGTFNNDAVLRCFEKVVGRSVVRPDIAGIMGAYGAALLSKDLHQPGDISEILSEDALTGFNATSETKHCGKCTNECLLTELTFSGKRRFVTGNRCEMGSGDDRVKRDIPNLMDYKFKRMFGYKPLSKDKAIRGEIGMPRAMNMYEHYPFWFTFFTSLGYRVVLSGRSSNRLFAAGMDTIPSESLCYPAKLVHGHVADLINKGVKTIFYPCLPKEKKEKEDVLRNFNCPVVISYPEVIKANVQQIMSGEVQLIYPFLPIDSPKHFKRRICEEMAVLGLEKKEVLVALKRAYEEQRRFKEDICRQGERVLNWMEENGVKGIILAGRPYHIDEEINHGIPQMINGLGLAVLTEDAVAHLAPKNYPLRVINQWVYHSRLYAAAAFAGTRNDLELVQLNSFGCGLDAITTDQVQDILQQNNKNYTLIKIDEINNLGAVRIRIRSLLAAMREREQHGIVACCNYIHKERIVFTKEMKKTYTVLCPQMAPIHFELLHKILVQEGLNLKILPYEGPEVVEKGLLHVHNDACYPTIIVVGQIMHALQSGKYDLQRTAVMISQTGGPCRASEYIMFIRKALKDAGLDHIPVISLNTVGWEKNPGLKLNLSILKSAAKACIYGDLLMRLTYATRPYELESGASEYSLQLCLDRYKDSLPNVDKKKFVDRVEQAIDTFSGIEVTDVKKPRVGIVGEILVKYHPFANNYIVDIIEKEGGEVIVPGLTDFFLNALEDIGYLARYLSGSKIAAAVAGFTSRWIESYLDIVRAALSESKRYHPPNRIKDMVELTRPYMQLGHHAGEGWLLTGEMLEFLEEGVNNIACLQPFACLPNHIVGKGMMRKLKHHYPMANIVPLDYDPGASQVNQVNRIKLMMAVAHRNMEQDLIP
ncbi:MAG: 2-hydroxyacyl-CoA dehydratase, partial [Peptococcaceae bacterium]|nr:2-hydroxyacyl-CoA dehydratase [Peptococcaceae bacterium]